MQTKRKTDLFRFVTLRAPQLISKDKRTIGFIEHPNPAGSHYLKSISPNHALSTKQSLIKKANSSFKPFTSVEQVKSLSEPMWEYSLWLAENKNKLNRTIIDNVIPKALFSAAKIIKIWDNVFYDILEQKNPYIRQACLQLIVAQNFVTNYKTYSPDSTISEEKLEAEMTALKRLANGKVIINEGLSATQTNEPIVIGYTQFDAIKQSPVHKAKLAELKEPVLTKIKEELISLEKKYNSDYEATFEARRATYENEVEQVVAKYIERVPELKKKFQNIEETRITKKGIVKESEELTEKRNIEELVPLEYELPENLVKNFVFNFDAPLSDKYSKEKVSNITSAFIQKRELQKSTIEEAIEGVDKMLTENSKVISLAKRKSYKEVMINGIQTRKSEHTPNDFAISFHPSSVAGEAGNSDGPEMYLSMNTGYNGAFLTDPKFSIEINRKKHELNDVEVLSTSNRNIFVKINISKDLNIAERKSIDFQANFKLDNGTEYQIAKKAYIDYKEYTTGIAIPIASAGKSIQHYGVNRIGVADFRRVEQELCCYVAGEVSHIENIMAREYKEKSTRHLTSSETTTELSTEKEMEESNDTTSTSRFEISSEIAEVLEKDRSTNLGFSTGASGEYAKVSFNANVYGDFSFGQSSSESNSAAKTYAEDVTRRALERIVQRASLKRTSRILREFEENNRHGYDNRDGDEHVTGVFRWIDKVYKNRIVNYNKRLMYEFMIPEPARFYKDAIIIKAEEEEISTSGGGNTGSTNVSVKPDHPSVHGINSQNDITRTSYEQQSAIYGVSVDPPKDEFVTLSKPYSENVGGKDREYSYNYPAEMTIPTDYQGCNVKFESNFSYTARTGNKAYMRVSAAGKTHSTPQYRGNGSNSFSKNFVISGVTGGVGVSVVTKKIRAFSLTVTVKCCLLDSVLNAWKMNVYDQIMAAYTEQLDAYNAAQNTDEEVIPTSSAGKDSSLQLNPKFNAQVVKTELKRLCIEMLTKPFGIKQGRNLLDKGACEVPKIKLGPMLDVYGSQVKFFEQAFDWDIMAQMFYPYYWANRCDWKELFQSQASNDHIFQAFLQSGMSRVVVPIRQGFEDAVTYFMETGEIWNGIGLALDTDNELYLSIMDEMTQIEGTVEGEEWETIVPSSLTIVQARSAYLNDEGLPCCETDEDVIKQLNIEASSNILKRQADA